MLKRLLCLLSSGALFLLVFFSSSVVFNGGCTKTVHDTTVVTEYDTITVTEYDTISTGSTFVCWLSDYYQQALLVSDPVADTAQSKVTIRWGANSEVFPYEMYYPGYLAFGHDLYLDPQVNYTVSLTSDVGSCEGTIMLPGWTDITYPPDDTILPISDIIVTWTQAQSASFYEYYFYCDAYDANGNWLDWYYEYGFVTTTSYTIDSTVFDVPNAAYYEVYFDVYPYSGTPPTPGAHGNMTGSIPGFLMGEGYGDYAYFYVGAVVKKSGIKPQHERPSTKDRMNTYLRQLGIDITVK